jgi:hypothetical protein
VLENQNSALLRLPREICDCIWKHALGGNIFPVAKKYRRSEAYTSVPKAARSSNGIALLPTCRQIYSETVSVPLRFGTIACASLSALKQSAKTLKRYQRERVTKIRVACAGYGYNEWADHWLRIHRVDIKMLFPSLVQIEVFIYIPEEEPSERSQWQASRVRENLSNVSGCQVIVRWMPKLNSRYFEASKRYIIGYFTTPLLYNYSLKSSSEDYKLEKLHLPNCLAFL